MKKKRPFGFPLPEKYVRKDLGKIHTFPGMTDLDLRILQLLAAHPALKMKFKHDNLASLDDATKRYLLNDINTVLGIVPLKKTKHDAS